MTESEKQLKSYKKFRNEILDWTKARFVDTIKLTYNPDDDNFEIWTR